VPELLCCNGGGGGGDDESIIVLKNKPLDFSQTQLRYFI
jgi:hypothetical protein